MREEAFYIGKPIRSLQTMLRTLSKTRRGQPSVVPDGIYGGDTARAVSAFQRQEGLPVTGEADSETFRRAAQAFDRESPLVLPAAALEIIWQPHDRIRPGERSLHLFLIQSMLHALGQVYENAPRLNITGVHDEQSVRAVKWLQERCGRRPNGSIDQIDWQYLTRLYRLAAGDGKHTFGEHSRRRP